MPFSREPLMVLLSVAMFNRIIAGHCPPGCLSSDHDPLFRYKQWEANLRILEVEQVKTVPYIPLSHPFVERLIGSIRHEYLDKVPFWSTADLEKKLALYKDYYNLARPHQGITGAIPSQFRENTASTVKVSKTFRWRRHCNGLFQVPEAA